MLRWTTLKFVAEPRKGTVLDPSFSIRNLIRDRSDFIPKHKRSLDNALTMLSSIASTFFIALPENMQRAIQC